MAEPQTAPQTDNPLAKRSAAIKAAARDIGFELVGIAPAAAPPGHPRFLDWLDRGLAGEMTYLERRKQAYAHPSGVMPTVRSVIMLGLNYFSEDDGFSKDDGGNKEECGSEHERGGHSGTAVMARISRYARAEQDYHTVIRNRLKQLARAVHAIDSDCHTRGVVDTAPLLERDFARLAGLGWFGKNTLLINKHRGSYFFLAGLLTDMELEPDEPHQSAHCGTCTRCLDACPTDAFLEPSVLDARKCISYLTIELKGGIPPELRSGVGDWLFGCDVCQDVCPWNRKSTVARDRDFQPAEGMSAVDALTIFQLSQEEFRQRFGKSALARPGRNGLRRNAAIVLGNTRNPAAIPSLESALTDQDPIIRGSAAWALGQMPDQSGVEALRTRLSLETDEGVQAEIAAAIAAAETAC